GLACATRIARDINTAKTRQPSEVDPSDVWTIRNKNRGAGILELVPHFALAESWIQQGADGSGYRASVVSHAELSGVVQEDGYQLARFDPARRTSVSNSFDMLCLFGAASSTVRGGI